MHQQAAQATWNPERDLWETDSMDLFSGLSDVFSETLPISGMTRSGRLFLRPQSAPHTAGSASSSSPGLLRTPCAAEAEGGMLHPDKAEREGRTLRLSSQIVHMVEPDQLRDELLPTPLAGDADNGNVNSPDSRRAQGRSVGMQNVAPTIAAGFGNYAPAVQRWEAVTGREAPAPTELTDKGKHRLSAAFVEWMMGLPDGWVTDPDLGLSRVSQLRALGNGVVPQQAVYAITWLLERAELNLTEWTAA